MTLFKLALRGLMHYWRTNLAAALGIATAAAVLAGAWTVGTSVRESLRELAFSRLGQTRFALISDGFFREALAPQAPLIALEAVVTHDESGRRASGVAVYGVDQRFWEFHGRAVNQPKGGEVLLSPGLARELNARADDAILVRIPRVSAVPTDSLHGEKDDPGRTLRGRMREVVTRSGMGEFTLRPTQGEVRAVFMPLARLQRELELEGKVNTALLTNAPNVKASYTLADIGLRQRGRMLEHESFVLRDALVQKVKQVDGQAQAVFTYLANSIRGAGRETPYSMVVAINRPDLPDDSSIVLTEWVGSDLAAKIGDKVELEYYLWEPSGKLLTRSAAFNISAIVPVNPTDRELAPEYPGISGAESVADWDPPFPLELKRIRPKDEEFWNKYRATPKAYISLAAGQTLWRSRYGAVTAVRVSPAFNAEKLRAALDPSQAGLTVLDARGSTEAASQGTTDFGEYFLYFSFFLVMAALLLAGLFFRFGLEARAGEIATLRALGFSAAALRKIFLTEGLGLAIAGGLAGVAGAGAFSALILTGLRTWWVGAVGTSELNLHFTPSAALLALMSALVVGPAVVFFGLRSISRRAPRETTTPKGSRNGIVAGVLLILAAALLFTGGPGGFFGAGAALLAAALLLLSRWLRSTPGAVNTVRGLGLRYTTYRPGRSVLCVALIASATFLVVAIDSFRRDTGVGERGWRYFAESAIPVYHDPNTPAGREALNLPDTVASAKWLSFRLRPGDDASCLNLYAPRNPRVLGVPATYLSLPQSSDGAIAAAVDANTLQYVLHKKVGDVIDVGGARLRIAQTLHDSVFQSELLISDADFQRAFPEEGGFRVFLIEGGSGLDAELERGLADYGLDVTTTAERLASYHRVENTYLSTFQALGGLGLVLGTAGLAAVLSRNVLERRRELGLLRAVGFRRDHLATMTFAENLLLLIAGLGIGVACALVTVLPTVTQRGGSPPVLSVLGLFAAVLMAGLLSSWIAVRVALRTPLLASLKSE